MSGDDGLREALARWCAWGYGGQEYAETRSFSAEVGGHWFDVADDLLALPELAALRAKADAADRVYELLATSPTRHHHVSKLRAALDGPSPC